MTLNDRARQLIARAARAAAHEMRYRVALGASIDSLAVEAWQDAQVQNPDFREWFNAWNYFEAVFLGELEDR